MALLLDSHQPVHFIGVGGIGMSALAMILADRGQPVSGSDPRDNATVQDLRGRGVRVFSEQTATSINALLDTRSGTDRRDQLQFPPTTLNWSEPAKKAWRSGIAPICSPP